MPLIKDMIQDAPSTPGVYIMKSPSGTVLYVGKAKSLKSRLKSYLQEVDQPVKNAVMLRKVKFVEWILTPTENDALLLECNLIKQHRPQYNILFRDDKNFPYLCVDTTHDFPKLSVVRKIKKDDKLYFGPYNQVGSIHAIVRTLNKAFQLRDCTDSTFKSVDRPCINYDIGTCTAPCVDYVTKESYGQQLSSLKKFLTGHAEDVLAHIEQNMKAASDREDFESAARFRNQLHALEAMVHQQQMISTDTSLEMDVFALAPAKETRAAFGCVSIRGGKVIGFRCFPFEMNNEVDVMESFATFLTQYYQSNLTPKVVLLPQGIAREDCDLIRQCLSSDAAVRVKSARTDEELYQWKFAHTNAEATLEEHLSENQEAQKALEEIRDELHLSKIPHTIECVDISHFQGDMTVASVVHFVDAQPSKANYRHFTLRDVQKVDDFKAIAEVVTRRIRRALKDESFPDLLVIDGGIGQLNAAAAVLKEFHIQQTELASLAKSRTERAPRSHLIHQSDERIFRPGRKNPIYLREGSRSYSVLVRLRDEAHRFAITAYRQKHGKRLKSSVLESLKGIGHKRKTLLLTHFPSIEDMLKASPQEWCGLLQCSEEQARQWIVDLKDLWSKK